jgi:hypothetical protein|tara:strand:+ start:2722 stop:2961 length:240 start_codon:yes stop_codon:yes gene_type:complete
MIKLTLRNNLITHNPFRVSDYMGNMSEQVTDVKKYDINRRIYLPKWVEEDLGLMPGQSYVTFVQDKNNILIKKVSISIA